MNLLSLFNTTGWIFGPAILLAGGVALLSCLRASSWARNPPARRTAWVVSLFPAGAGVDAMAFGFAACWRANQSVDWFALGKAGLAGLLVSAVPLVWAALLLRVSRRVA